MRHGPSFHTMSIVSWNNKFNHLEKGDKIGIVAPAGFMPVEKMQACIETLDSWGYTPELGSTTHSDSQNYFSGTDDERLEDFQRMLNDKKNKSHSVCKRWIWYEQDHRPYRFQSI